jgi:hypothetical protein
MRLLSHRRSERRAGWAIRRAWIILLLGSSPGLLSCGGDPGVTDPPDPNPDPGPVPDEELIFLKASADAPPLLTSDTSFVATRGEDIKVEIFYAPEQGSGQQVGDRFLELELDDESLLQYPAGHPMAGATFQAGDTITITIRIDGNELIATLEPTGLEFNPERPAELELRYTNADDDFDGDGDEDPELEGEIDLWRQEKPGDLWFRVGEIKDADLKRVRARLTSFSRYALAI